MRLQKLHPLFLPALVLLAACSSLPPQQRSAALTILHWNDFHARNIPYEVTKTDTLTGERVRYRVGGTANLVGHMNHHGRGREHVAVLNAGDDFQGTPVSTLTFGRSQMELMNIIAPDAMVLGNHEFDYGADSLRANLARATFPVLAANVFDSTQGKTFAPPSLVRSFGTVKAGIIGLVPPDLPVLSLRESLRKTRMLDVDSVLSVQIAELKKHAVDLIIVLSHMGYEVDTLLALRRSDIDVIVGGHTHLPLFTPVKKNRTVIVQAGSYGRYLGKLELTVDLAGDSVLSYNGTLIETREGMVPLDSAAYRAAMAFESIVDAGLKEVIGTLQVDWRRDFHHESNIGNWHADVMRAYANTDIAFLNSGGLRKNLPAGPITRRDILEIHPFNNSYVTFSVSGEMLLRMLEWQAARRGEFMQVSGIRYAFDPRLPFGEKVVEGRVNGTPIDTARSYSIVTNNYVAGHLPALFGIPQERVTLTPLSAIDHEVITAAVERQGTITSAVEGRVRSLSPEGKVDKE